MNSAEKNGRLYGIGVGPGDPDLMTLKAVKILNSVSVIAYLAPESGNSSARTIAAPHIPEGVREIEIRVPMRPGTIPVEPYDRGAEEITSALRAGDDVAVLCEGDPFFFGSFMYLHDRLAGRFCTFVVPGVTSLTACAAAAGTPLVRRNGDLLVLPATLADDHLEARIAAASAVAIVKVGRHLGRVRAVLEHLDLARRAVLVAYATRPDEKVQRLVDVDEDTAPYFSMILIPDKTGISESTDAPASAVLP